MSNELDYGLAFSVADYFNLKESEAKKIYDEVMLSVKNWEAVASGIDRIIRAKPPEHWIIVSCLHIN